VPRFSQPARERRTLGRAGIAVLAGVCAALAAAPAPAAFDLPAAIQAAAPGTTLHVPPGRYAAPVVIDRPLTLIADGAVVIDAAGVGSALRIDAPNVTLRGLVVRNTGHSLDREDAGIIITAPRAVIEHCRLEDVLLGIIFRNADETLVRDNLIRGKPLELGRRGDALRVWHSDAVRIENNTISGCRDVVVWFSTGTHLARNEVSQNRYGMHFMYAQQSVLEDNYLHDNSVGVFLMYSERSSLRRNVLARNRGPSGYGLGLKDMDALVAVDNLIVGNRVGIFIDNSPQRIDTWNEFHQNSVAYNDIALAFLPSVRRNRIWGNAFVENAAQLSVLGGGTFAGNEFTAGGRGNYWSDYAGFDADGDGIGDVAYQNTNLFEALLDRAPNLRLFLYSPAQQALEFAARAFPIVRPEPRIRDDAPLMRAPLPVGLAAAQAPARPLLPFGAMLLAGSVLLLMVARPSPLRLLSARSRPVSAPSPAPATDQPILVVRDLHKRFGRTIAVAGVSFEVPAGQALGLWGANGAGKTTVIKCLLGLHRARGHVLLGDIDARRHGKRARQLVGYVSQELAFDPDVAAGAAVAFFARLRGVSTARVPQVLTQVGLADQTRKRVGALSGGMKQRLALAIALLADPPLLLLDEPTSNLDVTARRTFLDLLRTLKQAGKTIVFTTHRHEEAAALADRIIVLERGRITRDGPPAQSLPSAPVGLVLRLLIERHNHERAATALRNAGFAVSPNCEALHVSVRTGGKAEPIQLLERAGVAVRDFELEATDEHA